MTAAVRRDSTPPAVRLRGTYLAALENARLIPVVAPPVPALAVESAAAALVRRLDGLVLSGGEDVAPELYGAVPHPALGPVAPDRDAWELSLVAAARAAGVPVLAICRGVQLLNVALGGTLVQDIASELPGALEHDQQQERAERTHPVAIAPDSLLARVLGATCLEVNSVHHQAVRSVAPALRVVGTAPDGVIEALESAADDWWCLGVQWHPEDLADSPASADARLFQEFAGAARERARAAA